MKLAGSQRWLVLALGLIVLGPHGVLAQPVDTLTFVTVDGVGLTREYGYWFVSISGLPQNQTNPQTVRVIFGNDASPDAALALASDCKRSALLAMAKPGRYLLRVTGPNTTAASCYLSLARP